MTTKDKDPIIPILSWRGSPITKHSRPQRPSLENREEEGDEMGDFEEYWSKIETILHMESGLDLADEQELEEGQSLPSGELDESADGNEQYSDEDYEDAEEDDNGDDDEDEDEDEDKDDDINEIPDGEDGAKFFEAMDAYRALNKMSPRYTEGGFGLPRELSSVNPSAAVAQMLHVLDNLKKENFTADELKNARRLAAVELTEQEQAAARVVGHRYPKEFEEDSQEEVDKDNSGYRDYDDHDEEEQAMEPSDFRRVPKAETKKKTAMSNKKMTEYILRKDIVSEEEAFMQQGAKKSAAADADSRHRKMLMDMAEKRRQDEDEAYRQYIKAQKRRKKFKEALLEKALRSREESADGDPSIPAGGATKSFLHQKVAKKAAEPTTLTEEEEKAKKNKLVMMRRKFKDEYKKVLENLMTKNQLKEQEDKERTKTLPKRKKVTPNLVDNNVDPLTLPVGSALSVIRNREDADTDDNGKDSTSESPTTHVEVASAIRDGRDEFTDVEVEDGDQPQCTEQELAEQKTRRLANKMQQLKIAAYLSTLAEQKKTEENKKLVLEQRAKRRAAILSARLLNEATERKRMAAEDKYSIVEPPKPTEKKVKLTAAESEAIFNRLSGGYRRNTSDENSVEKKAAVPTLVKRSQIVNKKMKETDGGDDDQQSDDSSGEANNNVQEGPGQSQQVTQQPVDSRRAPPAPRDFNDWKRKNSVPLDAKVFSMTGWYPCVKQALLERGWYMNSDPQSPFFDLKWSLRSCEVSLEQLQPWQLTNHFLKNGAITTKVGLLRSLQSLVWFADVSPNDIIPRGYDLTNPQETLLFMDDFACQHAENALKSIYFSCTGCEKLAEQDLVTPAQGTETDVFSRPETPRVTANEPVQVNEAVLRTCFDILQRKIRLKEVDADYLDDPNTGCDEQQAVTNLEWEILCTVNTFKLGDLPFVAAASVESTVRGKLEEEETIESSLPPSQKEKLKQALREKERARLRREEAQRTQAAKSVKRMVAIDDSTLSRIHTILLALRRLDVTQSGLAGTGSDCKNMWIVKPAAKSRGRGIMCFNDLPKLLKYVSADTGTSTLWIVQKYMENALIVAKRKFDLRQWVLVTDWNPLTIYFYDECYARFSVEEYSTNDSSMDNLYVHLVNNSIGKTSENFNKTAEAEDGTVIEGYMWSCATFGEHIKNMHGVDYMNEKIRPRMKDIAKWSLMSASDMVDHRKNSWELYGFDYMVDSDFNAWLIEINSSPACDYSTKVTERYVQKALVELLSVTLDCREYDAAPRKTRGDRPSTGGWECIYKGPLLETPVASFGADMSLKGEAIKAPRRPAPAVVPFNLSIGNSGSVSTEKGLSNSQKLSVNSSSRTVQPFEGRDETSISNTFKNTNTKTTPLQIERIQSQQHSQQQAHPSATYTSILRPSQQQTTVASITPNDPLFSIARDENLLSKIKPAPPSLDDSVSFDDSDGENDHQTTRETLDELFQFQEQAKSTAVPLVGISNNVTKSNNSVSIVKTNTSKKVQSKQILSAVPIQPKLFTVDF